MEKVLTNTFVIGEVTEQKEKGGKTKVAIIEEMESVEEIFKGISKILFDSKKIFKKPFRRFEENVGGKTITIKKLTKEIGKMLEDAIEASSDEGGMSIPLNITEINFYDTERETKEKEKNSIVTVCSITIGYVADTDTDEDDY